MGSKKTEVVNKVPEASEGEKRLMNLIQQISGEASTEFSSMKGLTSGESLKLSPEDLALIEQAVGSQTQSATAALREDFKLQNAAMRDELRGIGQDDSSMELVRRLAQGGEQARALESVRLQGAQLGAQYGMQLPFQRANTQIAANSAVLAKLGVMNPALQNFLQARLAGTGQTSTQSGFSLGELAPLLA